MATTTTSKNRVTAIGPDPTNGGAEAVAAGEPYTCEVEILGVADLLLKRWNCESIAEKAAAPKNSKAKKTDDLETYVYRDDSGYICLPGEYLRMSIIGAAKFRQDPRSPRKSAQDLYKAAVVSLTPLASLGVKCWDYEDKRRVVVQRNGITRIRPAFKVGWHIKVVFMVTLPEYVSPQDLNDMVSTAGRLIGVGDFRPTYGRFQVTRFALVTP